MTAKDELTMIIIEALLVKSFAVLAQVGKSHSGGHSDPLGKIRVKYNWSENLKIRGMM